jgi:hypothetical protein
MMGERKGGRIGMAPDFKTGKPKGFVSSNLTPSATVRKVLLGPLWRDLTETIDGIQQLAGNSLG